MDGQPVDAARTCGNDWGFTLPPHPREVRIISRAAAPAELGLACDPRALGVAVRRISAWQGAKLALLAARDATLRDGFHRYETECDLRWTDGDARVPDALPTQFAGPVELVVRVCGSTWFAL